jgi:spore coat polysaccharide biosynthesis predicted glycosyltransferase SpsG
VNKTLILTEAGKNIGLGHYTRCSAICDAFETNGDEVFLMVFLNDFSIANNKIIKANWLQNLQHTLAYKECDTVVVDSYLAQEDVYKKLHKIFKKLIVIDDYNRLQYPATALINPNVFFNDIEYTNQKIKCIGGKDYVILRKEFRQLPKEAFIKKEIEEILITVGGTDFRNILPSVTKACLEAQIHRIAVITSEIHDLNEEDERVSVLPLQDASGMYQLMQKADLVISACGQTLHELASLGKPTIGICLDVDQQPNQKFYLEKEFLPMRIDWGDDDIINKIQTAITLYQPGEKRKFIASNAPSLINKSGVDNIISAIKNFDV